MAQGISIPVVQSGLEASIQQGARNVGQINIQASVDPSAFRNLAQPLGRVSGLATEFEKSIAASNARVLAFGASVGIINGVQNAFTNLVKTGIEVQKTLADIAAISGKSGQELSKFGDSLFEIGKTTGQTFKTASEAALEFSRQGLSVEETLKRTSDALTLTRFTTLSAAEAVDVLTAAANSFSETGITTAQIINKLVAVDTKFAVSAEDLAKGLARAGSIAQEVGVNFDQLNAAVTVAQERTARGGAVIGNALKTIFTRLRSDETVQALRNVGVESLDAQGQLKGAIPLLEELSKKLQGLSGGERIQILEAVASKYNINILSALLNDLGTANSKFGEAVAISAGANNQAYERQIELNKTLAAQINNATVSATQLFNKLSEIGVTESLATLLKFVGDLINSFNKLLSSESVGGDIAKGLIKGISDVFFTVGLPILAAIFVKLTADIAKFGVESLKTILGINQQVRERQALEQAVVNTLIRDQEVMASILALSGNRAKQEEYLLGVYNRQLNALQQVQNIASSVTPALMAGGLSATSGQVKKRGAGGYLPAQEAADVRRGVGGASSSSQVVSIPNFAFGGGKRGTMVANTSEYIVPNFANGGSAIFNQDMARAYGLPAGAKKISAAGGYVPNFAATGDYAALVGEKAIGEKGFLQSAVKYVKKGKDNQLEVSQSDAQGGEPIAFDIYGVPSQSVSQIAKAKEALSDTGKNLAVNIARSMTKDLPSDLVKGKLAATFNPGSLQSFANTVFEASIGSLLGDKRFDDYAEQTTTSAFDLDIANNPNIKESLGIANAVKFLEVKGNKTPKLMDSVAKKIYQVTQEGRAATSKRKIGDTEAKQQGIDRPYSDLKKLQVTETIEGKQYTKSFASQKELEVYIANKYSKSFGSSLKSGAWSDAFIKRGREEFRGASGYIPNFAQDPLKDAIGREIAAGVSPSKIRVTQDGRLRNSGNPNGLAVINTRDEPNGKIPNFANVPNDELQDMGLNSVRSNSKQRRAGRNVGVDFDYGVGSSGYPQPIGPQLPTMAGPSAPSPSSVEKTTIGMDKMLVAFGGLSLATSILQSSFKDTSNIFSQGAIAFSQAAQAATAFGSVGSLIQQSGLGQKLIGQIDETSKIGKFQTGLGKGGLGGKLLGGLGSAVKALPIAGAIGGAVQSVLINIAENQLTKVENAPAKKAGIESVKGFTDERDIRAQMLNLGQSIIANPKDDKTNAAYDELKRKLEEINKNKKEAAKEDKKQSEELMKRIALSTKINSLNEAAAIGENKATENRSKRESEFIKNSVFLTESQKLDADNNEKLLQIQEKRDDLKRSTLLNTTKEVAQGNSLTTAEQNALNSLIKRLEAGEDIKNVEKELLNLSIQGNSEASKKIADSLSGLRIADSRLATEVKTTKERQIAERSAKAILDREKLINNSILQRIDFLDQERNIRNEFSRESSSLKRQLPLKQLEAQISGKAFATPEEDLKRLQLQREGKIEQEKANITEASNKRQQDSYIFLRKSILENVSSLTYLNDATQKDFKTRISSINLIEDETERMEALRKVFAEKIKQQYYVDPKGNADEQAKNAELLKTAQEKLTKELEIQNAILKNGTELDKQRLQLVIDTKTYEEKIAEIRAKSKPMAGFARAFGDMEKESANFAETFTYNTTNAFRDGLRDAMGAAISQTDDLGAALQNVAMGFLKTMQNAFLQNAANNITMAIGAKMFAKGGVVTGGSGYRDDVPAMLTGGEFVMRKSAVQKYGAANLAKMNSGGMFIPGTRGGGEITGEEALRAFSNQTTTSGATDVLKGGRSSAFINLEDQSQRLSRYALLGDDTISQEVRSAQSQAFDILKNKSDFEKQQKEAEKQQKKALTRQLISTVASAALSYGVGKAFGGAPTKGLSKLPVSYGASANPASYGPMAFGPFSGAGKGMFKAYGGAVRRYASGGPTDDIPAMLMSGEYIMNRQSTSKYGKRMLDSMNQGRAPRFADGGQVGSADSTTTTESNAKMMGDVSININVTGQTSQTETQGNSSQGGIDYKKMSERIKTVVLETLNEEKRLGGSLRTR